FLRRHLLPVPGGHSAAALRPVRARWHGYHRRGARGAGDHHGAAVAGDPATGVCRRNPRQTGSLGLLGAGCAARRRGRRLIVMAGQRRAGPRIGTLKTLGKPVPWLARGQGNSEVTRAPRRRGGGWRRTSGAVGGGGPAEEWRADR